MSPVVHGLMGLVAPRHVGSSGTGDALAGGFLIPGKFHVHGFESHINSVSSQVQWSSDGCVD